MRVRAGCLLQKKRYTGLKRKFSTRDHYKVRVRQDPVIAAVTERMAARPGPVIAAEAMGVDVAVADGKAVPTRTQKRHAIWAKLSDF